MLSSCSMLYYWQ